MSKKYVRTRNGNNFVVDFFCIVEDGKTVLSVENAYHSVLHELAVHYRPPRTLDDHMGNTECGYFCVVPFPDGCHQRVYMY